MKRSLLSLALLLIVSVGFGQVTGNRTLNGPTGGTEIVYSKVNFTNTTTAETTGFLDMRLNGEIGFITQSTDSASVDLYFIGRNDIITAATTTYADSLITTSNSGSFTSTVIKSSTLNRLPNEPFIRIGVVCRSSGNGFTSGRTLKVWLVKKSP